MDYLFNSQKTLTGSNPNTHNRLVVGSNPTEPTFEAILPQNATDFLQKLRMPTPSEHLVSPAFVLLTPFSPSA